MEFYYNIKKFTPLLFVLIISGCLSSEKIIDEDVSEKFNDQIVEPQYFYSNEIINPDTLEKYFVRRDKGINQCAIIGNSIPSAEECALPPYMSSEEVGICGQDRTDFDPTICQLIKILPDGSFEFVMDLISPDSEEDALNFYENYYANRIVTGAELIEFQAPNKIIIFFGYDFSDSHRGTIAVFDLETKQLSKYIIDHYYTGDRSFFHIEKQNKNLFFINDIDSPHYESIIIEGIEENGIYLKDEERIKKITFPDVYNFDDRPFVDLRVRENYQNGSLVVLTVFGEKFVFDFTSESFLNN